MRVTVYASGNQREKEYMAWNSSKRTIFTCLRLFTALYSRPKAIPSQHTTTLIDCACASISLLMDFSVRITPTMNGVIKLEDLVNMSESVHDDGIPAEVLMGSPRSTQTRKIPQRKTEDDGLRKTRKSRLKESVDVPALLEKLAKEEHCGSENPGKRKSYDIEFKLTAVEYAEKHSKKKAADHFKVDRRQIQLWCQKKELLQQQLNATEDGVVKKRLAGAGRTVHDWSLDYQLMGWMNNMRDEGVALSRSCIQEKAKELALNKDFKASNGWLERFLKRHSQSLLRPVNSNLEILAKNEDEMTD